MSVVPGDVDTDRQPPMTVPLRHFLVGLGFLLAGSALGVGLVVGRSTVATLVHVHLLLVGWVCVTIMGAMTQFVPVWSGVTLHSRRLATWQLWLVVLGLLGFAGSLLVGSPGWTPGFGFLVLAGFWTFVYNVGRTLLTVDRLDLTERHFAVALGFFLLVTVLGVLLALDFTVPVFESVPVTRSNVVSAHATLAVFGAVLTTILGALYQLATMFTQTELHGVDVPLRRVEEVAYPVGVVALTAGRLAGTTALARAGGLLLVVSLAGFALVLARRLHEMQVAWTPMHRRYAVAAAAMGLWAVLTAPAWLTHPLSRTALFGADGAGHLLVLGVIGFVVLGTLYHIVPFIIWVHRYSDLLGFQDVPMIDDLYDDWIAMADFALLVVGTGAVVVTEWFDVTAIVGASGGVLVTAGVLLFLANQLLVVRRHSPYPILGILFDTVAAPAGGDRRQTEEGDPTTSR